MVPKRLTIVIFALHAGLLAGCMSAPDIPSPAPAIPDQNTSSPSSERVLDEPQTSDTRSATLALLRQSERAGRAGEHHEAVGYIERAIRLNPLQADLWTALASIHLTNEDPVNALRFANKAVSLAGRRADWLRDAWLVIADAKAQQGKQTEAAEIRKRWRSYRG